MQSVSQLHNWHHDSYAEAEADIHQSIGDISKEEIFGRQVLCAVYVRPGKTNAGVHVTTSAQQEDVWQGKVMLILKMGPDAFQGEESYHKAMFGDAPAPKVGDWVFARPNDGVAMSICGEGAERPKGKDFRGDPLDKYDWNGWPCRILPDEQIFGRMSLPHHIV